MMMLGKRPVVEKTDCRAKIRHEVIRIPSRYHMHAWLNFWRAPDLCLAFNRPRTLTLL